jgi:hypothetical protein
MVLAGVLTVFLAGMAWAFDMRRLNEEVVSIFLLDRMTS